MRLAIEDLHFSYPGKKILNGVSLTVNASEIACIVGPNGSGKSTLVKCVEAINRPDSGAVLIDGVDAKAMSALDMARVVAYVPQSGGLLFSTTVFDAVMMGRKPYSSWKSAAEDEDIVIDVLARMELDDIALEEFNHLSGGQQQRVLIARALAQRPSILLLDEPTSALDIAHQLEVMEIIHALAHEQGMAVLMVVHDLNLVSRYADRVAMMDRGRIHVQGDAASVFTHDNIMAVYKVRSHIGMCEGKLSVIPLDRCCRRNATLVGLTK